MSTSTELKETPPNWVVPETVALNQVMWRKWEAKGQYQDREANRAQSKAMYWVSIAALLAAVALWSRLPPYEVVVRFLVCIGAVTAAFQSFRLRRYAMVVVFALVVGLFNPILPVLDFTGEWQRVVVLLSVLPFGLSLSKLAARRTQNA
ncbi:DUF6804 family protein [Paludibaculum fermentans]|uniref:Uncharacterized protein n=1 Tax=Paludibaculum fermentans TaxID=1473598 RepID=A0A7S7NMM8_PALFE|nr:DUF6804 family protein [Paludibaculum fermentans]QOY86441.1 hypothetical protein IRI77_27090 [Paludibaculum fermentans]